MTYVQTPDDSEPSSAQLAARISNLETLVDALVSARPLRPSGTEGVSFAPTAEQPLLTNWGTPPYTDWSRPDGYTTNMYRVPVSLNLEQLHAAFTKWNA